jgi:hypothetical protein
MQAQDDDRFLLRPLARYAPYCMEHIDLKGTSGRYGLSSALSATRLAHDDPAIFILAN